MNKSARIPSLSSRKAASQRSRESSDTADIPVVRIPVRCPHCDVEQLCEFPEPVVVMALTRWNNMNLYVPCHDGFWSASRSELHVIRSYLGEAWLKVRAQSIVTQHPLLRIFA